MSNKIKRFILCLLSALTLATAGTIHAEGDEFDLMTNASADEAEVGEEAAESKSKRTESVEEVELTAAEAERLLHKIGSVDGFDIYSKSEKFKDEIRAAHGGNPKDEENYDKNAGMTAEDKAAEADIALLKKIGVLVAVDPEAGRAIASFDGGKKCNQGKIFLSTAGRYLLTVDEEP